MSTCLSSTTMKRKIFKQQQPVTKIVCVVHFMCEYYTYTWWILVLASLFAYKMKLICITNHRNLKKYKTRNEIEKKRTNRASFFIQFLPLYSHQLNHYSDLYHRHRQNQCYTYNNTCHYRWPSMFARLLMLLSLSIHVCSPLCHDLQ